MWIEVVWVVAGLALIIQGGNLFVAAAVFGGVGMDPASQWVNFPALLGMFGLLVWMLWRDPRLTRREGIWLMIAYGAYLAMVTVMAVGGSR